MALSARPSRPLSVGWFLATLLVDVGLVFAVRWSSPKRAHGAASAAGAVEGEGVERGREGGRVILFCLLQQLGESNNWCYEDGAFCSLKISGEDDFAGVSCKRVRGLCSIYHVGRYSSGLRVGFIIV